MKPQAITLNEYEIADLFCDYAALYIESKISADNDPEGLLLCAASNFTYAINRWADRKLWDGLIEVFMARL